MSIRDRLLVRFLAVGAWLLLSTTLLAQHCLSPEVANRYYVYYTSSDPAEVLSAMLENLHISDSGLRQRLALSYLEGHRALEDEFRAEGATLDAAEARAWRILDACLQAEAEGQTPMKHFVQKQLIVEWKLTGAEFGLLRATDLIAEGSLPLMPVDADLQLRFAEGLIHQMPDQFAVEAKAVARQLLREYLDEPALEKGFGLSLLLRVLIAQGQADEIFAEAFEAGSPRVSETMLLFIFETEEFCSNRLMELAIQFLDDLRDAPRATWDMSLTSSAFTFLERTKDRIQTRRFVTSLLTEDPGAFYYILPKVAELVEDAKSHQCEGDASRLLRASDHLTSAALSLQKTFAEPEEERQGDSRVAQ